MAPDPGNVELLGLGVHTVGARNDVGRRPLEEHDAFGDAGDAGDARHDLNGGCSRADHADALAGEIHAVIPRGGVEHGSREALQPGDRRHPRLGQPTGGDDEHTAAIPAGRGLELPACRFGPPPHLENIGSEPHPREQALLPRRVLQVVMDLGRAGVELAQVGLGAKREGGSQRRPTSRPGG